MLVATKQHTYQMLLGATKQHTYQMLLGACVILLSRLYIYIGNRTQCAFIFIVYLIPIRYSVKCIMCRIETLKISQVKNVHNNHFDSI